MKKYIVVGILAALTLSLGYVAVDTQLFKADTLAEKESSETEEKEENNDYVRTRGIRTLEDLVLYDKKPELFQPRDSRHGQPQIRTLEDLMNSDYEPVRDGKVKRRPKQIRTLHDLILYAMDPDSFKGSDDSYNEADVNLAFNYVDVEDAKTIKITFTKKAVLSDDAKENFIIAESKDPSAIIDISEIKISGNGRNLTITTEDALEDKAYTLTGRSIKDEDGKEMSSKYSKISFKGQEDAPAEEPAEEPADEEGDDDDDLELI